jgi:hypothetical protein
MQGLETTFSLELPQFLPQTYINGATWREGDQIYATLYLIRRTILVTALPYRRHSFSDR